MQVVAAVSNPHAHLAGAGFGDFSRSYQTFCALRSPSICGDSRPLMAGQTTRPAIRAVAGSLWVVNRKSPLGTDKDFPYAVGLPDLIQGEPCTRLIYAKHIATIPVEES